MGLDTLPLSLLVSCVSSGVLLDLFRLRYLDQFITGFDQAGVLSEAEVGVTYHRDPFVTIDDGFLREDTIRLGRDFLSGEFRFTITFFRIRRRDCESAADSPLIDQDYHITCKERVADLTNNSRTEDHVAREVTMIHVVIK